MTINKFKSFFIFLPIAILAIFSVTFNKSVFANPDTFTVTNTNDSGAGSFRQALIDANSNGNPSDMDVINFNISGSGVKTITPATVYPNISEKVTINGYSQPGSSVNVAPTPQPINSVILIEFDGVNSALNLLSLNITAAGSVVKGINMHECRNFDSNSESSCISIKADNVLIQGNYLGLMPDGQTSIPYSSTTTNATGVSVTSGTGAVIGGTRPEDRNILTNNNIVTQAIALASSNSIVEGNYIGIARDGITDLDSSGGINISPSSSGNRVGGPLPAQRNLISGAPQSNLTILGNNNIVQGNYICSDYTGAVNNSISTGSGGVSVVFGAQENQIGGINPGEANLIAGCSMAGIGVVRVVIPLASIDATPHNNSFLGNIIFGVREGTFGLSGTATARSAIVFGATSDTDGDFIPDTGTIDGYLNDPLDADAGPNNSMNYPVFNTAVQNGNQLTFNYDLDTADSPSNEYRVEFFASDPSEVGSEGGMTQAFLGAVTVAPGSAQSSTITLPDNTNLSGKVFSATATAVNSSLAYGFGSTSRVSPSIALTSESGTVGSNGSSGNGVVGTGSSSSSALASTGQNILMLIAAGTVLILISAVVYKKSRNA